jgi:hypothetical protein
MLSNIEAGFRDAFIKAEEWRHKAMAIHVTSLDQTAEMKMARIARLELKTIRVSAEKTRKLLKEDSLRMSRAIDGVNNLLLAAIEPLERHLEDQEKFADRLQAAERERIVAERIAALAPFIAEGQALPPLESMTDDQFGSFLEDAKLLHVAKIEAAKRAESERIARELADAAERARICAENERLKAEAAEREAAMKAEREAAEKELARIKADAEAAARVEALRQQDLREVERQKAEAAEKEAAELRAAAAATAAASEKKAKAEAEANKKAAAAPDREKIRAMIADYEAVEVPAVKDDELLAAVNAFQRKYKVAREELAAAIA